MVIRLVSETKTADFKAEVNAAERLATSVTPTSFPRSAYAMLLGETLLEIAELRVKLDRLKAELDVKETRQ